MVRLFSRKQKEEEWQQIVGKAIDEYEAENKKEPGYWRQKLARYKWEAKNKPDYTKSPEVDEELERQKDPFGYSLKTMSPEEREKALKEREEYENSFLYKFEKRAWELEKRRIAAETAENDTPARKEDTKFWRSLPPIIAPNGLPYVKKGLVGENEAAGRIMDFFKQHLFGLWGYRQRPYPPEYPIDLQQAMGYKWLHKRYADFTRKAGGWYYKDRLGRTRGPMELVNMQTAWCAGIIDKNTFIWGDDMDEWAPIGQVYGLEQCINTPQINLVTQGMAAIYKLTKGVPLNKPRKGHEPKTMKQLQDEAIEQRDREQAVLRLNGGVWPGEREPPHTLFLWAGGSKLTDRLDNFSVNMPDKFIDYRMRKKLMRVCPSLRPRDLINLEQIMDALTYQGEWYREPLGTFTTRPDYEAEWFKDMQENYEDTVEEVEHFFNSIEGAPKVVFPRRPEQKFVVEKRRDESKD